MKENYNTVSVERVPFVQIPNVLFDDRNTSLKAKGLFGYMASKPPGWKFHINGMASQLKEGREAITSALQELEAAGWLKRQKRRIGNRFDGYNYTLIRNWPSRDTGFPDTEKTWCGKSASETPYHGNHEAENPPHSNNIKSNTKGSKNKKNKTQTERERDFFSENKELISVYADEIIKEGEVKNEKAYRRKIIRQFQKEDRSTLEAFKEWLPGHHARELTKRYRGLVLSVNSKGEPIKEEGRSKLYEITHNEGSFILKLNNGRKLSTDTLEILTKILQLNAEEAGAA